MKNWPDIPGITSVGASARLPRDPAVVAEILHMAAMSSGASLAELSAAVTARFRVDSARVQGLLGWLPVSHVARWGPKGLAIDGRTDPLDLALRFSAWASTQPVLSDHAEASRAYAQGVTEAAALLPRAFVDAPSLPALAPSGGSEGAHGSPLTERLRTLLTALDGAFLEREVHIRAALLALLSGQHVLLLGPPGTAKSMLARALTQCFVGATGFEYLLSRFSHPDELFGPVSIPGLKEEDYRRLTDGFLPTAHIAFLDEIFKANSAILNSLLTLINERVFHHGKHRDQVPLIGLLGASNELPDPEGGLGALYDRFLVRLAVPPVASPEAFLTLATGQLTALSIPPEARLTLEDIAALRAAAEHVTVPPTVAASLVRLWTAGERLGWECSDRRWRQAVKTLKTAAAADGRTEVSSLDLMLLEHVLCPTPDRTLEVREAILEGISTQGVPTHDLRAQWLLLGMDRTAPIGDTVWSVPPPGASWNERLTCRRENLSLFVAHHEAALSRLAGDRERVDSMAESHLWIARLPSAVLANHVEASRDLAHILDAAETYRHELSSPEATAGALLDRLPRAGHRRYGSGAVVKLQLPAVGREIGVTLAGEREEADGPRKDGLVQPTEGDVPVLTLDPVQFLAWIDGTITTEQLTSGMPSWASRNLTTALHGVRRALGESALPSPPVLRDP